MTFSIKCAALKLFLLTVALGGCSVSGGLGAGTLNPIAPTERKVGASNIPDASFIPAPVESWSLPNGLTVLYRYDGEIPLVRGELYVPGGTLWAGDAPVGTFDALGSQMRLGGAGNFAPEALDRSLERYAASVSAGFSGEYATISFSALAQDLEPVFAHFADVALRPRFESRPFTVWKGQILEGIRRRAEDPETVAGVSLAQLFYQNTPYGRVLTDKDLERLRVEDLRAVHRRFLRPDGSYLVLVGALSHADAERLAERYFGAWKPRGSPLERPPTLTADPQPGIVFIAGPFTQATVVAAQRSVEPLSPFHYAIEVFNSLFGAGGLTDRLAQYVRTEKGLAYVVYGGVAPARVLGRNVLGVQTRAESAGAALQATIEVLTKMQREPVSADELAEGKGTRENSFVFKFDSPDEIARRRAVLKLLGFPTDYDQGYLGRIAALSARDIQEVASQLWDPKKFVIVVVGPESAYTSLESYVRTPGHALSGVSLRRGTFDQQLHLP